VAKIFQEISSYFFILLKMPEIRMPKTNKAKGKELYDMVQEYSEYSTVAGILYIFMPQQTTAGKMFWVLVVVSMLALSTYWSVVLYFQWEGQTVITTVLTAALPVNQIKFPAVTICSQGFNYNTFMASLFLLYNDYAEYEIEPGTAPIDSASAYTSIYINTPVIFFLITFF
jgi:hypothetical protein